jgi:hypothetical protein
VAYAVDGKSVATWGEVPRCWDGCTGKELRRFVHPKTAWTVTLSPDLRILATGGKLSALASPLGGPAYGTFELSEAASGKKLCSVLGTVALRGYPPQATFSQNTRYLAHSSGGFNPTIRVWADRKPATRQH